MKSEKAKKGEINQQYHKLWNYRDGEYESYTWDMIKAALREYLAAWEKKENLKLAT